MIPAPSARRRRLMTLERWALRAGALPLVAGAGGLTLLARHVLAHAAHPIDTPPVWIAMQAVEFALVAAMLLAPAGWAFLGGGRRVGRWVSLAAPATTLALLPWTAATDAGIGINLLAGLVAGAGWLLAARARR